MPANSLRLLISRVFNRLIPGLSKAFDAIECLAGSFMILTEPCPQGFMTCSQNISYDYFGDATDRVVPGDYDGDGKTDIAVVRGFNIAPSRITWHIRYSSGQQDDALDFGEGSNFGFAQGDYDGDGKDDIAFLVNNGDDQMSFAYRPSSNPSEGYRAYPWGIRGDLPAAGYNNR